MLWDLLQRNRNTTILITRIHALYAPLLQCETPLKLIAEKNLEKPPQSTIATAVSGALTCPAVRTELSVLMSDRNSDSRSKTPI